MSSSEQAEVLLTHAAGLHARPAVKFTQVAKGFESMVEFSAGDGDDWVNAKSIVKVMGAKVSAGTLLRIRASGVDAAHAVAALVRLVASDFDAEQVRCDDVD